MLVLTRKIGEKVKIGGNITLAVVAVENSRVRLAFDAPKDVLILRAELVPARHDNVESNVVVSDGLVGRHQTIEV